MKSPVQSSLLTRPSLLSRLRNWGDNSSWDEFHRLYRRFIQGLALRAGLNHTEAEDVVQDVMQNVAQRISEYEVRDNRGAFRRWLMNQTRWRIADKFRQRDRAAVRSERHLPVDGEGDFDALDNIADDNPVDEFWEIEWQKHVLDTAMERLARRVPAKHFQAFELYARQGWPVRRIASDLGINSATIYLISHRLTKQLRSEVERLRDYHG
ncbi:RNA polymerase sigma factor [Synoicihabitans lomoniglobus]|uniref:Sigma-70 family RNA polymerase sigma factor n=1 Tax=Synoicihabitans lomoniglobus TaxID=2909285 RepID=A0AAE9ZZY7_9BACT|nr:sigma-70 family RNA polymerase sigma factor [Opitutaceae bacterium LMO-M01]WED64633.1 sigma-70 family RNA polymerase sigma factor [Opitutaceae bacterium LMO-M01]